jgi:hypothetical protein
MGETPQLGVINGITLRMSDSFPRMTRKGYGKDIMARNFSVSPTLRAKKSRQSSGIDWSLLRIKQQSEVEWKHFFIKLLQRWSSYINVHLTPPLERLERVMEMIQSVETSRLGVSKGWGLKSARFLSLNNPKGSWKGYKGLKPLGWGFLKDKTKDIQKIIRPNPFLG